MNGRLTRYKGYGSLFLFHGWVPTQALDDPSYSDVCIPSPPPDLDYPDISERDFAVVGSDPHRFDREGDRIGCE